AGTGVVLAARDGPPRESPRERQKPHRPQLRVHPVALPGVAAVLVAVPRSADEERTDGGGRRGGPPAPVEEARAEVDGDRPEREQQVEEPEERRLIAGAEG